MIEAVSFLSNTNSYQSLTFRAGKSSVTKQAGGNISAVKTVAFDWLTIDNYLKLNRSKKTLSELLNPKVSKCSPAARQQERELKIQNEKNHVSNPVTERTEFNTKQLLASGIKERDVYKYLKRDGHVTDEGKKILKAHGKRYK